MTELASVNYPDLTFQLGDAEDLPFAENSFDAVLINFGILHFPDADRALSEAFRVLKRLPQGTPIFRFADHEECQRVLKGIGFEDGSCTNLLLTWRLPRADDLMESFRNATVRTSGMLGAQDPKVLPAISAAMTEGCKPFDKGDHTALPMPAVLTVGTKA
jgi:SAM-dependent methyltransferase